MQSTPDIELEVVHGTESVESVHGTHGTESVNGTENVEKNSSITILIKPSKEFIDISTVDTVNEMIDKAIGKYFEPIDEFIKKHHKLSYRRRLIEIMVIVTLIICGAVGIYFLIAWLVPYQLPLAIIVTVLITFIFSYCAGIDILKIHARLMCHFYKNLLETKYSDISSISTFADEVLTNPQRARHWWYIQNKYAMLKISMLGDRDNELDSEYTNECNDILLISRLTTIPPLEKTHDWTNVYFTPRDDDPMRIKHKNMTQSYSLIKQTLLFTFRRGLTIEQYERNLSDLTSEDMRVRPPEKKESV